MPSFEDLYASYAADVYRFALFLSADEALAEDLTAETFVRVWTARDLRVETVKAYLLAIVRNLYRQRLRSAKREVAMDASLADPHPGPEHDATTRDQLQWVMKRLHDLPETDCAALLMRVQQDMSYAEIAAALQLSIAAAKVRVHRARLKLTRLWTEELNASDT
jgi:RNA polymerase sigma-70 factor (ECF subfamily)